MRKQLCACGCLTLVTRKVEAQHLKALAPALLASQVLDKNQRLIRRKKRSKAIGSSAPFRQQHMRDMHMGSDNDDLVSRNSPIMMGEDLDVYGQSK